MYTTSSPVAKRAPVTDPEKADRTVEAVVLTGMALVALFVGLRIYRRLMTTRNWGLDDYHAPLGPGEPSNGFTTGYAKVWLAQIALYPISAMLVRLSLFALYYRVFGDASGSTRRLCIAGSIVVALFYPTMGFLMVGLCAPRPGDGGYVAAVATRRCTRPNASRFYIMSSFNIASDVFLFVLPVRIVWRLQMPTRRKLAVSALFLVGLLACICALLRIIFYHIQFHDKDKSLLTIQLDCVTYSEITIGIVCACMPVVWGSCVRSWAILTRLPASALSLCACSSSGDGKAKSITTTTMTGTTTVTANTNTTLLTSKGRDSSGEFCIAGALDPATKPATAFVTTTAIDRIDSAPADAADIALAAADGKVPVDVNRAATAAGTKAAAAVARRQRPHRRDRSNNRRDARRLFPRLPRVPNVATMTGLRSLFGGGGGGSSSGGHGAAAGGGAEGGSDVESLAGDYYHAHLRAPT